MSDLLIKGMEMPKSCMHGGCPLDGAACDLWEDKYWQSPAEPYRKRHPKCPLLEVPAPHGRLIDADLLKTDYLVSSTSTGTVCTQYVSLFQIVNAPTIIEAGE